MNNPGYAALRSLRLARGPTPLGLSRRHQAVLEHPPAKLMPIDAQEPRRSALVVSRMFQSLQDMPALDLGGRQPATALDRIFRRRRLQRGPATASAKSSDETVSADVSGAPAATRGRTPASISSPGLKRIARSMAFSSSRTLPGQGYACNCFRAAAESRFQGMPFSTAKRRRKCSARISMSSVRSPRGESGWKPHSGGNTSPRGTVRQPLPAATRDSRPQECGHRPAYVVTADRRDHAILEDPQELGLQFEVQLANFVQEDRSAFRRAEAAHRVVRGPGKCPLEMPEHVAGEQGPRDHGNRPG